MRARALACVRGQVGLPRPKRQLSFSTLFAAATVLELVFSVLLRLRLCDAEPPITRYSVNVLGRCTVAPHASLLRWATGPAVPLRCAVRARRMRRVL